MPKSLVLGNGNVLVGLDRFAQVKDFYFPYVGLENQVGGHSVHKIGVWINGTFSWIDDGSWEIKIDYWSDTLVSAIEAYNYNLKIKIEFKDAVYNETDIFLREVNVYNLADEKRKIKIFFHQKFEIYESRRGDTAYFDPKNHTIIHYKGRRVFLINAVSDFDSFDDFSIGNFNIEGKEGTFKDAEDGVLSQNPIEHGLVDSVIGFSANIDKEDNQKIYYWIACARLIKEANDLNDYVLKKTPPHLLRTTEDFWRAWVNKQNFNFVNLDSSLIKLFKKSLLIIRTHVDNRGAIIASCDSDMLQQGKDNYCYMWPRDGALVTSSLDLVGDTSIARRFFEFCNDVITDEGYFMHKYRTDKSLGSSWHPWVKDGQLELPIQEDETALVIIALKQHFDISKDLEFIESVYNSLIKKAADFMVSFRDEKTKLPKGSYDLWEEKFGIHTFTASAVYGALKAASEFAKLLGKLDQEEKYDRASIEVKEAILKYLYDESEGYFYKMINFENDQIKIDKTVDLSSAYGVFKFNVLDASDERLVKAFDLNKKNLEIKNNIGGICRYSGDNYFKIAQDLPGNPWFITTLWLSQFLIAKATKEENLNEARDILGWILKYSLPSGILSEQLNPLTGEQISAAPLTWSHSEFVATILQYIKKIESLGL